MILLISFVLSSLASLAQEDTTTVEDVPLTFPIVIWYQNNSADISHVSRLRLQVLTDYLNEHPEEKIIIEGHVCCGPDYRMSKKRARSVYKYLIHIGAPKEQMTFVGRSFDEPKVAKERNEADKNLNRRVEIELVR